MSGENDIELQVVNDSHPAVDPAMRALETRNNESKQRRNVTIVLISSVIILLATALIVILVLNVGHIRGNSSTSGGPDGEQGPLTSTDGGNDIPSTSEVQVGVNTTSSEDLLIGRSSSTGLSAPTASSTGVATCTSCVDYYVSSSLGKPKPTNTGRTPSSPWTLDEMMSQTSNWNGVALPGKVRIFLCAGDIFSMPPSGWTLRNLVGKANSFLEISTYKCKTTTDTKATLNGAYRVTGTPFVRSSGNANIYQLNLANFVSSGVTSLPMVAFEFGDAAAGTRRTSRYYAARFPDWADGPTGTHSGTSRTEFIYANRGASSPTYLEAPALAGKYPDNYWNGALLRYRINRFTYEARYVSAYNGAKGGFTVAKPFISDLISDLNDYKGFFLEPKNIAHLTQPGEFYFDAATKLLSIYVAPTDASALLVGSQVDLRLVTNLHTDWGIINPAGTTQYVSISNLRFQYAHHGISSNLETIESLYLDNLEMDHFAGFAVQGPYLGAHFRLTNSYIHHADWDGIQTAAALSTISHNVVSDVGLTAGYLNNPNNNQSPASGCCIRSDEAYIGYNQIARCGYAGVRANYGVLVEYNTITDTMLTLDDGGALYAYEQAPDGLQWKYNRIDRTIGNTISSAMTPDGDFATPFACAMYLDDHSSNTRIVGNIASNTAAACLFVHNNRNSTVTNNLCLDSGIAVRQDNSAQPVNSNTVTSNFVASYNVRKLKFAEMYQSQSGKTVVGAGYVASNSYCTTWNLAAASNSPYPLWSVYSPTGGMKTYSSFNAWTQIGQTLGLGQDVWTCKLSATVRTEVSRAPELPSPAMIQRTPGAASQPLTNAQIIASFA